MKTKILQEFLNSNIKIINQNKLEEYINFCIDKNQSKIIKGKTSCHHILPKAESCFPQWKDIKHNKWNATHLLYSDHYTAHYILTKAINNFSQYYAFVAMNNKDIKNGRLNEEDLIGPEEFQLINEKVNKEMSKNATKRMLENHPFSKKNTTLEQRRTRALKTAETRHKIKKSGLSSFQEGAIKGSITRKQNGNNTEIALKGVNTLKKDIDENGLNGIQRRSIKSADSKRGQKMIERTCPHCNKIGRGGNMKRYHFENCKILSKI